MQTWADIELFRNREDAGRYLADALDRFRDEDPIVLALPRGGVAVGHEVARALGAQLDVFVVRKIGAPFNPELGIGAVAEGGVRVLDDRMIQLLGIPERWVDATVQRELAEVERRVARYRGERPAPDLRGRTVILVDDGIATGGTATCAGVALRRQGPRRVILATPVAPPSVLATLRTHFDDVIVLITPESFGGVGTWYEDFHQLSDDEVLLFLEGSNRRDLRPVDIPVPLHPLHGDLAIPPDARGVVVIAHSSGSVRTRLRNRRIARELNEAGFATLLLPLLTEEEASVNTHAEHLRYDIALLAERLQRAVEWLASDPETSTLAVGALGAGTAATAALQVAAQRPELVQAVVSRGGRPDLASASLPNVRAPVLLLIGERDGTIVEANERAMRLLTCEKSMVVLPNVSNLFEEPGAMDEVARLCTAWFEGHLTPVPETA